VSSSATGSCSTADRCPSSGAPYARRPDERRAGEGSLALAGEFLTAAELVDEAALPHATVSCAVLAGTHANDAICQARTGGFSRTRDHADALRLARTAGPEGHRSAELYERLLSEKNKAQYDTAPVSAPPGGRDDLARAVVAG
jgi:hypothetical protein